MLEASDTAQRIGRVHARAFDIFGAEDAPTFLANPHPMLGGRTPLEAMTTDLGAREVERILSALEAGLPV
jgi:putative toxin-antitoxin system antitoxin component (TIGR02293 family)